MADATTQVTEGTNTTPQQGEGTTQTGAAAQSGAERTYTQAEVDELLSGYVPQERVDEMVSALHTQDEVNKLVGDARKKVRQQFEGYAQYKADAEAHADYDEVRAARDTALSELEALRSQMAHRDLLDKVHAATGVPSALLKGETEEELMASAEAVKAYVGAQVPEPPAYPQDKGGGANPSPITRDQIESIKDPVERVRVRAQHMDLYQ